MDTLNLIASVGQAGSFLVGTVAIILTLMRTRKSAFEKEVSNQLELKTLKMNGRMDIIEQLNIAYQKLIMQEIESMQGMFDLKLDSINLNTEKALILINEHIRKK